jgi:hypothetical protein
MSQNKSANSNSLDYGSQNDFFKMESLGNSLPDGNQNRGPGIGDLDSEETLGLGFPNSSPYYQNGPPGLFLGGNSFGGNQESEPAAKFTLDSSVESHLNPLSDELSEQNGTPKSGQNSASGKVPSGGKYNLKNSQASLDSIIDYGEDFDGLVDHPTQFDSRHDLVSFPKTEEIEWRNIQVSASEADVILPSNLNELTSDVKNEVEIAPAVDSSNTAERDN